MQISNYDIGFYNDLERLVNKLRKSNDFTVLNVREQKNTSYIFFVYRGMYYKLACNDKTKTCKILYKEWLLATIPLKEVSLEFIKEKCNKYKKIIKMRQKRKRLSK